MWGSGSSSAIQCVLFRASLSYMEGRERRMGIIPKRLKLEFEFRYQRLNYSFSRYYDNS